MKSLLTACALMVVAAPMVLALGPAPEPSSFVMLGTGIAGIGFVIWRRSRTKK